VPRNARRNRDDGALRTARGADHGPRKRRRKKKGPPRGRAVRTNWKVPLELPDRYFFVAVESDEEDVDPEDEADDPDDDAGSFASSLLTSFAFA
jgi:hypothetical protein